MSGPGADRELVLGLDLGTSSVKAVAVDRQGRVVARASAAYPTLHPGPGLVEQAPSAWWRAARMALGRLWAQGVAPGQAVGLGLSGHMSCLVLLDGRGAPVRPAILLADGRGAAEEFPKAAALLGAELSPRTGFAPSPAAIALKLLWVARHEPERLARARWLVMPKDYLRLRLTGEVGAEPTDAHNSLLYDPDAGSWATDLARRLGLDPGILPPLGRAAAEAGRVTAAAAWATGLPQGLSVRYGAADMAASALAMGVLGADLVSVTLGTAAQVVTRVPAVRPGFLGALTFHPQVEPGTWYVMGSVLSGAGVLPWVAGVLGFGRGTGAVGRLLAAASRAPLGSRGVTFVPYLMGRGTPRFDPRATAGWHGLHPGAGREDLARAAVEGIAASLREAVEAVEACAGPGRPLRLGGGGSRHPLWGGLLAALLARPLVPVEEPDASAVGAAMLAAHGAGWEGSLSRLGARWVREGTPRTPDPEAVEAMRRFYARWLAVRGDLPAPRGEGGAS